MVRSSVSADPETQWRAPRNRVGPIFTTLNWKICVLNLVDHPIFGPTQWPKSRFFTDCTEPSTVKLQHIVATRVICIDELPQVRVRRAKSSTPEMVPYVTHLTIHSYDIVTIYVYILYCVYIYNMCVCVLLSSLSLLSLLVALSLWLSWLSCLSLLYMFSFIVLVLFLLLDKNSVHKTMSGSLRSIPMRDITSEFYP